MIERGILVLINTRQKQKHLYLLQQMLSNAKKQFMKDEPAKRLTANFSPQTQGLDGDEERI